MNDTRFADTASNMDAPATAVPARDPLISSELHELSAVIERAEAIAPRCNERFESVLRNEPAVTKVPDDSPDPACKLAMEIRTMGRRVEAIVQQLTDFVDRCEL